MKFRSILFWMHLSCGVTAGLVILMMSVTGVLIMYERQMVAWADQAGIAAPTQSGPLLSLDALLESVRSHAPDVAPISITIRAEPESAVAVALSREHVVYVDPHTGAILGEGASGMRKFFVLVTQVHRWFNVGEEGRETARAITGASNLLFLFLVLSGMYLWLPRFFIRGQFRLRLLFVQKNIGSKARDFNWHHVFGIWASIPLALVVASATVFSYPWANNLVFSAFGEEPPVRTPPSQSTAGHDPVVAQPLPDMEDMLIPADQMVPGWKTITLRLPLPPAETVSYIVDRGNGGQPHLQSTLTLDARTGAVTRHEAFSDLSSGRQARAIIRRLHTGEIAGMTGQTIAGFVSFAAVMLVWTGLALAYRRLIQPWLDR